jgi:hypothetical protein
LTGEVWTPEALNPSASLPATRQFERTEQRIGGRCRLIA